MLYLEVDPSLSCHMPSSSSGFIILLLWWVIRRLATALIVLRWGEDEAAATVWCVLIVSLECVYVCVCAEKYQMDNM